MGGEGGGEWKAAPAEGWQKVLQTPSLCHLVVLGWSLSQLGVQADAGLMKPLSLNQGVFMKTRFKCDDLCSGT